MTVLSIVAVVTLLVGLISFIASLKRLKHGRIAAGLGHGTFATLFLLIGATLVAIGMNFYTYDRLTYQQVVADLIFTKIPGDRTFKVEVRYPGGKAKFYTLVGDEWQLFARIVKWTPKANLLGFNSQYRLERISNKYASVNEEKNGKRTIFSLHGNPGIDYIKYLTQYNSQWVDARFGQSVYHPMTDGAHYQVKITQSGLVSYVVNSSARKAVEQWKLKKENNK